MKFKDLYLNNLLFVVCTIFVLVLQNGFIRYGLTQAAGENYFMLGVVILLISALLTVPGTIVMFIIKKIAEVLKGKSDVK